MLTTYAARQLLKGAIMGHPTFFCPASGKMLDVRRSVLLIMTADDGRSASIVLDGEAFDTVEADGTLFRDGCTVEVFDGRKLHSRSTRQQEQGHRTLTVAVADPNQTALFQ